MGPTLYRAILWALLSLTLVSLGAGIYVAAERVVWEEQYRQLDVALDGNALQTLLEAGVDLAQIARRFGVVVLDAATVNAFGPLKLPPLNVFSPPPTTFSDEQLSRLKAQGLDIVVALPTLPVLDAPRLALLQNVIERVQPAGVLIVEAQRRWPPENVRQVVRLLDAVGSWYATLEFYQPSGLLDVFREGHRRWVRAHLIPWRERLTMTRSQVLARYERAAREREIRLLVLSSQDDPAALLDEADELSDRLQRAGFSVGQVPQLPPWALPAGVVVALSLAVLSLTLWSFQRVWQQRPWTLLPLAVVTLALILWQGQRGDAGLQFLALSVAIVVPLGLYRALVLGHTRRGLAWGLGALAWGSVLSALGGLIQAAFLSDPAYFLKLDAFHGVKLALIEPALIIAYWEMKRCKPGVWRRWWQRPLTWGEAALGAGTLGALFVLILRTGNDGWVPALPLEQHVRQQLENLFYARPRFKAFLLGHPLFVLWRARGSDRWGDVAVPLAFVAFLGQTTILNSFAHLHTPLAFTLLRTANGLLLGLVVGSALWGVVHRWTKKHSSDTASC